MSSNEDPAQPKKIKIKNKSKKDLHNFLHVKKNNKIKKNYISPGGFNVQPRVENHCSLESYSAFCRMSCCVFSLLALTAFLLSAVSPMYSDSSWTSVLWIVWLWATDLELWFSDCSFEFHLPAMYCYCFLSYSFSFVPLFSLYYH